MWVLNFLPDWLYPLLVGASIFGLIVAKFVPSLYRLPVQAASAAFLVVGLYMSGVVANENKWKLRVAEMEVQNAQKQTESAKENTKIVQKVVTKVQVVKQKGEEVIKYIDREVVVHDKQCEIPKTFVEAHNKAAEAPKK